MSEPNRNELREAAMKLAWERWENGWTIQDQYDTVWDEGYEAGKPKWIPVSELPDEEDDYLVQYGFNGDTGPFISTAEFFPEGDDPAGWLIHRTSSESAKVVAWMPIPPYTEGE